MSRKGQSSSGRVRFNLRGVLQVWKIRWSCVCQAKGSQGAVVRRSRITNRTGLHAISEFEMWFAIHTPNTSAIPSTVAIPPFTYVG